MFELIPAIDLKSGRCVRLLQGMMAQETVYFEDPLEAARLWVGQGATRLHLVDLDGAVSGSPKNLATVQRIVEKVSIPIQIGGGIRNEKQVAGYLDLGVDRVILGTLTCQDPQGVEALSRKYPKKIVLGLDARDGFLAVKGWVDITSIRAVDVLTPYANLPLAGVVYTDIRRDGMLTGPNLEALEDLLPRSPFPIIASGGITSIADVLALARLESRGLAGAIIGKALYAGSLNFRQALEAVRQSL